MFYAIKRTIRNLLRSPGTSILSVASIAACMLMMSCAAVIFLNIHLNLNAVQAENSILAFVREYEADSSMEETGEKIGQIQGISSIEFISKKDALRHYREKYGSGQSIPITEMAFRARYVIRVQNPKDVPAVVEGLRQIPEIDEVRENQTDTEKILNFKTGVDLVAVWIALILALTAITVNLATVKNSLGSRKKEIELSKMMGAYASFIYAPSMFEALFYGLAGSMIAFLISAALYKVMLNTMGSENVLSMMQWIDADTMVKYLLVLNASAGGITGLVGGIWAIATARKRRKR